MKILLKQSSASSIPTPTDQAPHSPTTIRRKANKAYKRFSKGSKHEPITLQSLPTELHLLILSYLPCGPSALFGLTNRYFYTLHRKIHPYPISLKHFCPDNDSCPGTVTTPDPRGYYCGTLFGQGVCRDLACDAGLKKEAFGSNGDVKVDSVGIRRRDEHGGELLGARLKVWMGRGWSFCAVCDVFHRRKAAGKLGWGAACPHRYKLWLGFGQERFTTTWLLYNHTIHTKPCKICDANCEDERPLFARLNGTINVVEML